MCNAKKQRSHKIIEDLRDEDIDPKAAKALRGGIKWCKENKEKLANNLAVCGGFSFLQPQIEDKVLADLPETQTEEQSSVVQLEQDAPHPAALIFRTLTPPPPYIAPPPPYVDADVPLAFPAVNMRFGTN